jgi:hypothetical protein
LILIWWGLAEKRAARQTVAAGGAARAALLCCDRPETPPPPNAATLSPSFGNHNAAGISLTTQELYLAVFVTRYLDLFTNFVSL